MRSNLRIAFILIIAAFCVHIVHHPNRKKIQISDGDAELYAAKQKQGCGHRAVSCVKFFFRLHIRLDIQSPQLDDLRKHLVDGEGAEFIQPLLWAVRNGRICVLGHDVGDILEHLKGEHELESDYTFKKGAYADNIRNFFAFYNEICDELKQDEELKNMLASQITGTCYPDPELKTLTIDVGFFISRYLNKDESAPTSDEWWPTDYTPALSVDDWEVLLNDADIFTDSSLEIMKRILDYGGKATCTQLAIKYGESKNFYNSGSSALARRIVNKTNCPIMSRDNDESKWWPVLYVGKAAKKDEEGSYVWKLRDELAEALGRVDL